MGAAWATAALAGLDARADDGSGLDVRAVAVEGPAAFGGKFLLYAPRNTPVGVRFPLVVLLHGKGETSDFDLGRSAWEARYGLTSSVARLRHAPILATPHRSDWTAARLAAVNAELATRPYAGLAFACPFTPDLAKLPLPAATLDRYAAWLADVVVPAARANAPVFGDAARTHLDGCSLGGFVGLEVFVRRPEAFGAWGGVQSAFGPQRAAPYAELLARITQARPHALHVETSEADPFRDANVALSRELTARRVPHELRLLPGQHDQPWLREAGTIEMLHWHDRLPR
ncbi:MAG TPA: hypothetical protein VGM56_01170 [Byssovorax sp.]